MLFGCPVSGVAPVLSGRRAVCQGGDLRHEVTNFGQEVRRHQEDMHGFDISSVHFFPHFKTGAVSQFKVILNVI